MSDEKQPWYEIAAKSPQLIRISEELLERLTGLCYEFGTDDPEAIIKILVDAEYNRLDAIAESGHWTNQIKTPKQ